MALRLLAVTTAVVAANIETQALVVRDASLPAAATQELKVFPRRLSTGRLGAFTDTSTLAVAYSSGQSKTYL